MDDLIPIGHFARMSRLSIKALRHYDDQRLLAPAWVDPSSGYRYYRPAQANRAEAIRILRLVDMPVDEIRDVLAEDDPAVTAGRLELHRQRLQERLADHERMLRFLERLIERGGTIMPYDVTIKDIPTHAVASVTVHTSLATIGDAIAKGFGAVVGAISAARVAPAGAPFIVYHQVIDEDTDGNIEICVPVPASTGERVGGPGDVVWKQVPGGPVAATTHRGPYAEIGPAYHTVTGWIHDHGHTITAPPREVYLNDPQLVAPEDLLTEVQFPIDAS
ncbi:MAG: MerR family transcriptional regulator [Ilumatobacteraceae bacterium]